MSFVAKIAALATVALSVGSVACSIGEEKVYTVKLPVMASNETIACNSPFVKPDLSKAKPCGGTRGKGHCYDKTKGAASEKEVAELSKDCDAGQVCMPDKVLEANGEKLKSCKSFGDKPGVCTSLIMDQLNAFKDTVPRGECDADERCAPCVRPDTGEDSHACDPVGVHKEACTEGEAGAKPQVCCHGAGTCMNGSGLPDGAGDKLPKDACKKDGQVCAPLALQNNQVTKCDMLGIEGVCIDVCFADMLRGTTTVTRAGCGPTELCLPCLIGKGQGMPGCS